MQGEGSRCCSLLFSSSLRTLFEQVTKCNFLGMVCVAFVNPLYFCLLTEPNAPPSSITGHDISSTSIFVDWDDVHAADQNGIILSYTVTYKALESQGSTKTIVVIGL